MSRHHLASVSARAILFLAFVVAPVFAAVVDNTDASLSFSTTATDDSCSTSVASASCASKWWIEEDSTFQGGSSHFTAGPSASVSLRFQGTTVHLIGSLFPADSAAKARVVLDEGTASIIDLATTSGSTSRVDGIRLFTQNGLDSTATHTITVSYDTASYNASAARRFLAIDAIQVDNGSLAGLIPSSTTPTAGFAPSPSNDPSTSNTLSNQSSDANSASSTSNSTTTSRSHGLAAGPIAAVAVCSIVLAGILALAAIYCVRTHRGRQPRRLKQYSKPRASVLGSVEKGQGNGSQVALVSPAYTGRPDSAAPQFSAMDGFSHTLFVAAAAVPLGRSATMNMPRRESTEAQRPISREFVRQASGLSHARSPEDMLSPMTSPPPDSAMDSASPSSAAPLLRQPRRVPAPLPLAHSNMVITSTATIDLEGDGNEATVPDRTMLHPHAVPTPLGSGSPRMAEWFHTVVIPPTPPANPPPAYTPRSGRRPRNLAELREKMSPSAWSPSPSSARRG